MKPQNLPPAAIYYFKARLRPLANPVFWVSVMILSSGTFFLWELWTNPERLSTFTQPASDSQNLNFNASSASDANEVPTGEDRDGGTAELSAEEMAIAEIEQLEAIARQSTPLGLSVTPERKPGPRTQVNNSPPQAPTAANIAGLTPEFQPSPSPQQTNKFGIYIPQNPFSNQGGGETVSSPSADTFFYHPEIATTSPDRIERQPVHPLQSAIERRSTNKIPFTPAVPQTQLTAEQLRPNAYGIVSSEELRPNADGRISSQELRPGATNLIAPTSSLSTEVVPQRTNVPANRSPNAARYTPPPTNSYDYLVQTAPGSGVSAPAIPSSSSVAPIYDLRGLPPQTISPQTGRANPENFNDFNYQGLEPSQLTPSPLSGNNPASENIFEGYSRINTFSDPW